VSLLIVTSAFAAVVSSNSVVAAAGVAQSAPVSTTMKGVIKSIDDNTNVLVPSSNKNAEVTFQLTADAKRSGELAAGGQVAVTYYYDKGQRIVTAVAGKTSK
jgi:hypothetical protein